MHGCRHYHVYDKNKKKYSPPFPQSNGTDCGVFVIKYAMCYAYGHSIKSVTNECSSYREMMKKDLCGLYVHYRNSLSNIGDEEMAASEQISDTIIDSINNLYEDSIEQNATRVEVAQVLMKLVEKVEKRERIVERLENTPTKKRRFGDYDLPESGRSKFSRASKEFSRVLRNRVLSVDELDDDEIDNIPLSELAMMCRTSEKSHSKSDNFGLDVSDAVSLHDETSSVPDIVKGSSTTSLHDETSSVPDIVKGSSTTSLHDETSSVPDIVKGSSTTSLHDETSSVPDKPNDTSNVAMDIQSESVIESGMQSFSARLRRLF